MLTGRLDLFPIDLERGLIEGEIVLDKYEMISMLVEVFGIRFYVTPFDITEIRVTEDGRLGLSFSVITSMIILNAILDAIAIRN